MELKHMEIQKKGVSIKSDVKSVIHFKGFLLM